MRNLLLALLASLLLTACAPESVDSYNTGETSQEIVALLNEREYGKAIWLLENQHGKNPQGEIAFLLGQAYLGRAGIEPLNFAARLSDPEPDVPAARALFPKCPRGVVPNPKDLETKCLFKRVYFLAPPADSPDFSRARYLLRRSYPIAAASPEWVNVLVGMVETISLTKRAGDLYLYSKNIQVTGGRVKFNMMDVGWLQAEGKASLDEAREALARANHAGEKISRMLNGVKANGWFERLDGTIEFAKSVGLSRFLDFVRENLLKQSDEIRYGETLDRLKTTLDLLDN